MAKGLWWNTATTVTPAARRHLLRFPIHKTCSRQGKFRYNSTSTSTTPPPPPPQSIPEPSFRNLQLVALTQAIPFVGFGFMDNAILIIAGDAIDTSLGIYLGISTLCAAAIGNIISDLAGIGLGTMIEDFCANVLKLPVADISAAQRTLRSVRTSSNLGMAVGMTFGCLLGMFPLLFIDSSKVEQLKKNAHLEALFQDVVTEAKHLIGAESTCLYLRVNVEDKAGSSEDQYQGVNSGKSGNFLFSASETHQIRPAVDGQHLYAMYYVVPNSSRAVKSPPKEITENKASSYSDSSEKKSTTSSGAHPKDTSKHSISGQEYGSRFVPIGKGIVSRAVLTGEAWNIVDVRREPDFLPDLYEYDGSIPENLKHMIVVPVLDGRGQAIGVIRALNKQPQRSRGVTTNAKQTSLEAAVLAAKEGNDPEAAAAVMQVGGGAMVVAPGGFTDADVQILKSLASHISVSLQSVFRDEEHEEMRLRDTIRILKEHGLEGIADPEVQKVTGKRRPSLFPAP